MQMSRRSCNLCSAEGSAFPQRFGTLHGVGFYFRLDAE